jgi:hypothetical protein
VTFGLPKLSNKILRLRLEKSEWLWQSLGSSLMLLLSFEVHQRCMREAVDWLQHLKPDVVFL